MSDVQSHLTGLSQRDSLRARVGEILDTWRKDSRPNARQVLEAHPEMWSEPSVVLDLALAEYRLRRAAGEEIPPTQFAAQFSTYRDQVLRLLSVERVLGSLELEVSWPEPGECFMEFELLRVLGVGAVGRVYLARQQTIGDRYVALKLTPFGYGEAHILGQLRHPNIVPVLSVHHDPDRRLYGVCMPYLGVATLQDVVRLAWRLPNGSRRRGTPPLEALARAAQGPGGIVLPESPDHEPPLWEVYTTYWDAIIHLGAELAEGLAYTHSKGVLHHDLKPSNVLLSPTGRPMLLDFNLARGPGQKSARLGGTVPYMSPEQFHATFLKESAPSVASSGKLHAQEEPSPETIALGASSDVYSLGALLFELCTGRLPHDESAENFQLYLERIMMSHLRGVPPVHTLNLDVPRPLAELIDACLRTERGGRPESARVVSEQLAAMTAGRTRGELRRKQRRVALCTLGILAGSVSLGYLAVAWWTKFRPNAALAGGLPPLATAARHTQSQPLEELIDAAFRAERDGQYQKAAELFTELLKRKPSDLWREHLAYCSVVSRNLAVARAQLQLLLTKDNQNARLQNNLGYVLMRTNNDVNRAAARFERAIELDPTLFQPYFNRAFCYLRSGNVTPEAARCIERAIELAPFKHHRLHYFASQIWRALETNAEGGHLRSEYHLNKAISRGAIPKGFPPQIPPNDAASATDLTEPILLHYCLPAIPYVRQ